MFKLPKFVGIDPFADGGIALLSHHLVIEKCIEMPLAGSHLDLMALIQYLTNIKEKANGCIEVGISKINRKFCYDNSVLNQATKNDELIRVFCESNGIKSYFINPSEWIRPFYRNSWNTIISAKDGRNCRHMQTALVLMFNKSFPDQSTETIRAQNNGQVHYGKINSLLVAKCAWSKHRKFARGKYNLYSELSGAK